MILRTGCQKSTGSTCKNKRAADSFPRDGVLCLIQRGMAHVCMLGYSPLYSVMQLTPHGNFNNVGLVRFTPGICTHSSPFGTHGRAQHDGSRSRAKQTPGAAERLRKEEQAKSPRFDDVGKIWPLSPLPSSRTVHPTAPGARSHAKRPPAARQLRVGTGSELDKFAMQHLHADPRPRTLEFQALMEPMGRA